MIDGEIRCAVREGNALLNAGPRVDLGVRDVRVTIRERALERVRIVVNAVGRNEHLGRSAPDGDRTRAVVLADERADVVADLFDHFGLVRGRLDVCTVQTLHVLRVEDAFHWHDPFEVVLDQIEVVARQDVGVEGGFVGVVRKDVPRAEFEIVQ